MTNERLTMLARQVRGLTSAEAAELIAAVRESQKPLAGLLGPTIEVLKDASICLEDAGYSKVGRNIAKEITRLRKLTTL